MQKPMLRLPADITVILASGSPRRKELLTQIGLPFTVIPSSAEENIPSGISPDMVVKSLSLLKAADVCKSQPAEALVIGADTIVVADDEILTKPKDEADAKAMLRRLSGRSHSVLTGLTVMRARDGKSVSVAEETSVYFKDLTDEEIASYIRTGEPMDKAGAYGVQGLGGLFIEKIDGDYYNVVGLPLQRLGRLLQEEFEIDLIWEV